MADKNLIQVNAYGNNLTFTPEGAVFRESDQIWPLLITTAAAEQVLMNESMVQASMLALLIESLKNISHGQTLQMGPFADWFFLNMKNEGQWIASPRDEVTANGEEEFVYGVKRTSQVSLAPDIVEHLEVVNDRSNLALIPPLRVIPGQIFYGLLDDNSTEIAEFRKNLGEIRRWTESSPDKLNPNTAGLSQLRGQSGNCTTRTNPHAVRCGRQVNHLVAAAAKQYGL